MAVAELADRRIYLGDMMKRLGIDPAGAVLAQWSLSYFTARHRCESCPRKQTCREWLQRTPGAVSAPPSFCPSADVLFELQFDQLHHSPDMRSAFR